MAYLRDRRAFGNIGTRKFRGARFGDPLSPRGPQYTKEGLILDYSTDVGPFTIIDQSGQDNTATLYSGRGLTMDGVSDLIDFGSPTFSEPVTSVTGYARSTDTSINLGLASATLSGNDTWETFSADTAAKDYGDAQWFNGVDTYVSFANATNLNPESVDFEVEQEVYIVDGTVTQAIISKGNVFSINTGWAISISASAGLVVKCNASNDSSQRASTSLSNATRSLSGWHTVGLKIDRTTNKIIGYLDGDNTGFIAGGGGPSSDSIAGFGSITSTDAVLVGVRGDSALYLKGLAAGCAITKGGVSSLAYTGLGNDPWKDTIGSNDGTLSGVDQTATEYFTNPDFILGTGYNGDLSDIRCLGATGTVLGHWTLADWSNPAGNTSNGKTIVDSGPNGYHGVCTGCSGFTGEATIPQTADKNWNNFYIIKDFNFSSSTDGISTGANTTTLGGVTLDAESDLFSQTSTANAGQHRSTISGIVPTSALGERVRVSGRIYIPTANVNCSHMVVTTNTSNTTLGAVSPTVDTWTDFSFITSSDSTTLRLWMSSSSTAAGLTITTGDVFYLSSLRVDALDVLISASDANDQIDAYGTAILEPRRNTQQLNLFGDGEYSSTPDSDSLDVTTEATWEIWGNFYGVPAATYDILSKFDTGSQRSWRIASGSAGAADELAFLTSSNGVASATSTLSGLTNKVSHVCFTLSGGVLLAYIDGVSATIAPALNLPLFNSTAPVLVGALRLSGVESFFADKKIGSAKIYNRALTADEVLTNYESQKSLYFNVFPFTLT